jgi:hypothetical protein
MPRKMSRIPGGLIVLTFIILCSVESKVYVYSGHSQFKLDDAIESFLCHLFISIFVKCTLDYACS